MNRNISDIVDLWRREAKEQKGDFVVAMIDRILLGAAELAASDVHFQPGRQGVEVRLRLDGVLHVFGSLPSKHASQIAARLKVLAGLLTYKIDAPQEGRVQPERIPGLDREMRISTAPTIHGERIVVRFFSPSEECRYIESLGFGEEIQERLHMAIRRRSGALLIVGPSGSGKTTTAYALLRELAERSTEQTGAVRSIVSLEDPVEHDVDGVAQIEVSSRPESTMGGDEKNRALPLGRMLQYMMRQDPEVLLVGEIRERGTAEAAMQAALTGHLLISTFHAGSAVEAVGRFLELGIEPFVLRSSLSFVMCQRLLRRLCRCRKAVKERLDIRLQDEAFALERHFEPVGCPDCGGTGYSGRLPVAEVLPLEDETVVHAILDRQSTGTIRRLARQHGMITIAETVLRYIETGETSPLEAKRVLG